jgi:hypothetical protein
MTLERELLSNMKRFSDSLVVCPDNATQHVLIILKNRQSKCCLHKNTETYIREIIITLEIKIK